jgi:pimeloyl-ACP methyl ester carboxylesterase
MARIVLVHGAFNELWGPNELKAKWRPAVQDGLWHHGIEVGDDDIEVCFYGDLFRRHPGTEEERLLEQSRAGIAEALSDLEGANALAALSQAANDALFERTVDMVTVFTAEPKVRGQLQERLAALVTADTRVVVAHSFGTVIAYTALADHPEWPVHTFVTLGSPLAMPMMFETLGPPADGVGCWPGSVQRWVNVRALGDKAATPLADKFGPRVEEEFIYNGHRFHAPEPYLNSRPTGLAIAQGLGD